MKIVCSAASCKYSLESEDSSNVIFISFPNNETAAVWAHNCGRQDLLVKPISDLHANHYICSDHIDDRFYISKNNPIIIASGAIPTIFTVAEDSDNSMKHDTTNVADQVYQSQTVNDKVGSGYRTTIFNRHEESDTASGLSFCEMTENADQFQGISVRLTNLCRICGQPNDDGIDIFSAKGMELRLKEKIRLHTPISFELGDIMPQKLCHDCCDKLQATHSLVITCVQTDLRLRRFLNISSKQVTPFEVDRRYQVPTGYRTLYDNVQRLILEKKKNIESKSMEELNVRKKSIVIIKPGYDAKYADLVNTCTMNIADEMSLEKVVDNDDLSNNSGTSNKIEHANRFNCKWKENSSNMELEQVEMCPIIETGDDNMANLKYVVHSDLNNLLQALKGINPKNDERNDKTSTSITVVGDSEDNSRLVCSHCNDVFETRVTYESHGLVCNSEQLPNRRENDVLDATVVCSVCRCSFVDEKFYEKHKSSCDETLTKLDCRITEKLFENNKNNLDISDASHNEKYNFVVSNRRCGYCSSLYETRKELQTHITDCHDGQPLFKCGMCDKTYEKWSSLDVHEATHRIDKPYLCDLCGKSFKHSNNLRGHKRIHLDESKKKRHVCDVCGSAFRSRFHLREHMNQHNGNKPYTCDECGKAFYKRIQLRQHRLSHGSNKHACPICGVTFNRRGNMNMHLKRHNKSEGMYTCSVCECKCKSMSELKMHRKEHSESDIMESIRMKTADRTMWQCKICDKIFQKRGILANHERTHTGDRMRIECDKCGKILANKSSLKYHKKSLHSTERPHMCQFCGEAFVSRESRLLHERIHTGERPYICKICDMQYRCSSNLSQHMKSHSSERPHTCQYCNKTFTRKGALNVHERIHTGLKPFVCEICNRSFSQKNDMIKHTKIHQAKSMQCEKCDEIFKTRSDILKHLDLHEESAVVKSIIVEISQPLESHSRSVTCPTIVEDTNQLHIVQN